MKQRYYSLDVFRGATVALMILVNNAGNGDVSFAPLKHARWHGCTPTDLVFPFFLFAVGNAMAFVIPRLQEAGPALFWKKVIKRTVLIFAIGLFLNWWPFVQWLDGQLHFKHWVEATDPAQGVRILGVLQRIALAYFFASVLAFYCKPRLLLYIAPAILLFYWGLSLLFGTGDPYSLEGFFGTALDKQVLGIAHMYKGEGVPFDPEGLASTIPAIVQVLVGYLVGLYIKKQGAVDWIWRKAPLSAEPHFKLLSGLFVTGFIMLVLGWTWHLGFPINKKIWTSSYVFYTSGLATMLLASLIWFIEVLNVRNTLTRFFDVFGKNPLFIFVLSGLLPRFLALFRIAEPTTAVETETYTTPLKWFYTHLCAAIPGDPGIGSLAYALTFLLVMWLVGLYLDRKQIYIKV